MRLTVCLGIIGFFLQVLGASPAMALQRPDHLQGEPTFYVATGPAVRFVRQVVHNPTWRTPGWVDFLNTRGGTWWSMWDRQTVVPLRIWGSGMAAPGAVRWAIVAERHARDVLSRHLALLAPGAVVSDFVLVSNEVHRGVRTVGFGQTHQGLRVVSGQVSFRYKADRLVAMGSEALPWVYTRETTARIFPATAAHQAVQWIWEDLGLMVQAGPVRGPVVLPLVRRGGRPGEVSYRTVLVVTVDSVSPPARWDVYVDARTGEVVARHQLLRFASSNLIYNVPQRWPGGGRHDYPAAFADVSHDGTALTTDATGLVSWPGDFSIQIQATASGDYIDVQNDAGSEASHSLLLPVGGSATWDDRGTEYVDAQLNAFIHGNRVKEYARGLNPTLSWLDDTVTITVNVDDTCNAWSDGNDLFFLRSSNQCGNTGLLADVIYHEFGHSFHFNSMIGGMGAYDEALGEGVADYLSCTITGDPAMGRGFFKSEQPLRHVDPTGSEAVWPDDISYDGHQTGLIFAGAMWDLRKELVDQLGETAGVALANRLYYGVVQRASDIPSSYVEVLVEDDDDGDLSNGTPHGCAIRNHFSRHGLSGTEIVAGGRLLSPPVIDGLTVSVDALDPSDGCEVWAVTSAVLDWELRDAPSTNGQIALTASGDTYSGTIPDPPEGQVVRYRVTLEFADGTSFTFPRNPADPMYEIFVGTVVELYCTDFETNPEDDGWTHGLTSGEPGEGADDWMWGRPRADLSSGDPQDAFSGDRVFGNDLGGGDFNGRYQSNKVNFALSPVVDASGFQEVRLQYRRWLRVEDGYFDQATIYANDQHAWSNLDSNQGDRSNTHHEDYEWRFHDVDLTPYLESGQVQVKFEISSDGGLEFGGWTLDDVCIVGRRPYECGDGQVNATEHCDDGEANSDTEPDACRTTCRPAWCGDGVTDSSEECDDGNGVDDDSCSNMCVIQGATDPKAGCGCAASGSEAPAPVILLFFLAIWLSFRRRDP